MTTRWKWLSVAGVLVAALAAWRIGIRRSEVTAGGVHLGSLPSGVVRNELNLLVVTLDSTSAWRIGTGGRTRSRSGFSR